MNFYSSENRSELLKFINDILSNCRADWTQNYVVYPLPLVDELQSVIDNFRLILISIEASNYIRSIRAKTKYEINSIDTFINLDHQF